MFNERSSIRVGLLVLGALAAFLVGIFLIGEQNNLFRPMNDYLVRFGNVSGLQSGNPVQLNGVDVGRVSEIVLSELPSENRLEVRIEVDRRYARRIRKDSTARIQTLGLLGDKYIAISSGSEEAVLVPNRGEINAAPATNVDKLIASGEDAVENFVSISASLTRILERMDQGNSVLGLLMAPLPDDRRDRDVFDSLYSILDSVDRIALALDEGRGPLARLLLDEEMGSSLQRSMTRFENLMTAAESGDGLVPSLLHDTELRDSVARTVQNLEQSSAEIQQFVERFESGDGLVRRLVEDEEYAERVLGQLESAVGRLDKLSAEITEGDGTVARLLADPEVYDALNDVIVGVNESRMLRWLIRNRQKAGIEKRYDEARETEEADSETPRADPDESDDGDESDGGGADPEANPEDP